jgi:acyl transferase domain-containing protein/phosphopantetheinyl transferase
MKSLAEDIAIVGMACIFPKADTLARYWENIVNKVDCISDAPPDWQAELFYDPHGTNPEKSYTQRGGFLGELSRFNSLKYGVPPKDIEGAEPDHFLALRCAYDALADAGFPKVPLNRDKTGVIVGRGIFINRGIIGAFQRLMAIDEILSVLRKLEPHRSESEFELIRQELRRHLPPFNADTFPGLVHSALVGRIANRLDLHGPAYTLDAACASVSLAMEQGVRELRVGTCDAVIVGGSQVSIPASIQIGFCTVEALSRQGKVAPFSADAAGTLLGQGCGMIVIKRRSDAERDGNRIYALVKSVGSSSDGKGAGILAPLTSGQQLALRRAYVNAELDPATIGLVEAHGTGIPMGDATEMITLRTIFGERSGAQPTIALGSVKSMLGHLVPASGAASIIKTALALYHRVLPPTLHADAPHPQLKLDESPFYLVTEPKPWLHGRSDTPRRAGINAFGFGGINAHVVLEEHTVGVSAQQSCEQTWPAELIVLSAENRDALNRKAAKLRQWVAAGEQLRLMDIAATCAREEGACRMAIVACDVEDLRRKLDHAAKLLADPTRDKIQDRRGVYWYAQPLGHQGRLAFVFPGEGAQYVNMHAELCRHFPVVRQQFDLTDAAYHRWCGESLGSTIFPQPSQSEAADTRLLRMETAVAAVTASARGMLYLLRDLNVFPEAVVGHSSGEFAAVLASGAFQPRDDEELIRSIVDGIESTSRVARSELIPRAVLIAVGGADAASVRDVLAKSEGRLVLAMDNCPHQMVLVGDEASAAEALAALQGKGGLCQRIPWDRPYHTEAAAPICKFVEEYVQALCLRPPQVELWSCVTAAPFAASGQAVKELGVRQWRSRVRFRETILAMHAARCRLFVEVGPRGNLSAFIADTLMGQPHASIALDVPNQDGISQLCRALGMLVAHGVNVRLEKLFTRRQPQRLDYSSPPAKPTKPDPQLRLDLPIVELGDDVAAKLRLPPLASPVPTMEPSPNGVIGHNGAAMATLAPQHKPVVEEPSTDPPGNNGRSTPRQAALLSVAPRGGAAVMVDFQRTMQQFLATQKNVMQARFGSTTRLVSPSHVATRSMNAPTEETRSAVATRTKPHSKLRFIQYVLEHRDDHLVAECEFDLTRDLFLLDHAFFGRHLSEVDHRVHALPVMPLAMMLEVLAQAAITLRPHSFVQAINQISATRWLSFETPTRRIRITAMGETSTLVRVLLHEGDSDGMDKLLVSGIVELSSQPIAIGPAILPDTSQSSPPWRPEHVYGGIVYHGPVFQGIDVVEQWGPRGIRARIRTTLPNKLFSDGDASELILPVQLIDTASQLPGLTYTNHEQIGTTCRLTFPTFVERLEFSPAQPASSLLGIATFEERGGKLHSNVELICESGAAVVRYMGRVEEGIDIPLTLYRYAFVPDKIWLSRDISPLFPVAGITVTTADDGASRLYMKRLWREVLARMILGHDEHAALNAKKLSAEPLTNWLLGRAAAKDAVRLHAGLSCPMADVPIKNDTKGQPCTLVKSRALQVSVAHKDFLAVAAVGDSASWQGVGIDVERLQPLDSGVRADSFSHQESTLFASTSDSTLTECVAWAAKEAIGKALGTGIRGTLKSIEITAIDFDRRICCARILTENASIFSISPATTRQFEVIWNRLSDCIVAICLIPANVSTQLVT